MKQEKQIEKSLSDMLGEIRSNAETILLYPETSLHPIAEEIKENTSRINKGFRGLFTLAAIFFFLFIISLIGVFILYGSNKNLERLNDELIQDLKPNRQDSLKDKILLDEEGSMTYNIDSKGIPITYEKLSNTNDSLKKENNNLKLYLDTAKDIYGITIEDGGKSIKIKSSVVEDLEKDNSILQKQNLEYAKLYNDLLQKEIKRLTEK